MEQPKSEYLQSIFGTSDNMEIHKLLCDDNTLSDKEGSVKLPLPYEAPNHPPLPSVEDIVKAQKTQSLRQPFGLFPVCRVGQCVVKFGQCVRILEEAENLLYLEKHTQVRAPKLYAAYQANFPCSDGIHQLDFLVMEFLDGISLKEDLFMNIGERNQRIILERLGEQLQLLRSVKPEGVAYYGRVDYQGWNRGTTFVSYFNPGSRGPYDTYEDFMSAMLESNKFMFATESLTPEFSSYEIGILAELKRILGPSKHNKPVLTHFDLKWSNIIAWPIKNSANGECDDWKVAILDWDHAGWAPLYMQKASILQRLWAPKILEEAATFCGFRNDEYKEEVDVLMRLGEENELL